MMGCSSTQKQFLPLRKLVCQEEAASEAFSVYILQTLIRTLLNRPHESQCGKVPKGKSHKSGSTVQISLLLFGGNKQDILREGDTDHDGELNFEEFTRYLQERERKLLLMFHSLDHNHDGHIDVSEIQQTFHSLGVYISLQQAEKILHSIDKDGTMTIDWHEWRDHFLLNPLENMEEIVYYWKHSNPN
nr:calcium-binding mitochondrial carrier protein SCaMC-3-like [Zootoca vivipara]